MYFICLYTLDHSLLYLQVELAHGGSGRGPSSSDRRGGYGGGGGGAARYGASHRSEFRGVSSKGVWRLGHTLEYGIYYYLCFGN